jgi:phage-related protein
MNEELKIIITAVTGPAKKGIQGIKKELGGVSGSAKAASSGVGAAMKGIGIAVGAAVAVITALGVAIVKLGKSSLEFQRTQAKLNTAFISMGSTAEQAAESYNGLFRFLGDNDTSVEAAAHLAKLTTNQKELAEWTKICQGIYATFGDSLKIESLTEAANETARVGKVTGTMADALNWAGVSEDAFNAKLAQTVSFEEREALIRSTLNDLYKGAAEVYEQNNKAILEHNESQSRLNASMAAAGQAITPLLTALNNLCAAIFNLLKPAFDAIIPPIVTFVNWVTRGITAVMGLIGVVSGGELSLNTFSNMGAGISSAASGAGQLTSGLQDAAKAAEKAKRATMGFDELNVVGGGTSGSGGAGGTDAPGYTAPLVPTVDASKFTIEVEKTKKKSLGLLDTMKKVGKELLSTFNPVVSALSGAFKTIAQAWEESKGSLVTGVTNVFESFTTLGGYLLSDFVPSVINSFYGNLIPIVGDLFAFKLKEVIATFESLSGILLSATEEVIIPALELIKNVWDGLWSGVADGWATYGEPILTALSEAFEHIRSTVETVYYEFIEPIISTLIQTLQELWDNSLKPLWDKIVNAVFEIGACLLQLYNDFIAPIVDWIVANILPILKNYMDRLIEHFSKIISFVAEAIGGVIDVLKGLVQFIVGVFTGDWDKAWEGIKNVFGGIWDAIVGIAKVAWEHIKYPFTEAGAFFGDVWGLIKDVFSGVGSWFSDIFSGAWSGIKKAWSGTKSFFKDVFTGIKDAFKTIPNWFKDTFKKAWEGVKSVFTKGGKVFDGIKDGILDGLKAVINTLIGGINKVIAIPFNGLNDALETLKDLSILGVEPFGWIDTIPVPEIPKLARGGIVDRATLAMIGERGKEAVVPLENNTGWIDKLVDKLSARNNTPSKIVLMLDGKELGWANINSINDITRQTGALQLVMA